MRRKFKGEETYPYQKNVLSGFQHVSTIKTIAIFFPQIIWKHTQYTYDFSKIFWECTTHMKYTLLGHHWLFCITWNTHTSVTVVNQISTTVFSRLLSANEFNLSITIVVVFYWFNFVGFLFTYLTLKSRTCSVTFLTGKLHRIKQFYPILSFKYFEI